MKMKKGMIATISCLFGIAVGAASVHKIMGKTKQVSKEAKFRGYYQLLNQWLYLKNKGVSLEKYFTERNLNKIAIYGMGELGERLLEELREKEITVEYGVDKTGGYDNESFRVYSLEDDLDKLDKVDAIVITAVFDFEAIKKDLLNRVDIKILSLEDIVFALN
jgi:hypothetical protein